MDTATATLSAARRTGPKPQIPIGLQIAARWVAGMTADTEHLRDSLHAADGLAVRILHDPLTSTYDEGAGKEIAALAERLGLTDAEQRILALIPIGATNDPHRWLADYALCWQDAGLFIGLCLGFRIAAGLSGKE